MNNNYQGQEKVFLSVSFMRIRVKKESPRTLVFFVLTRMRMNETRMGMNNNFGGQEKVFLSIRVSFMRIHVKKRISANACFFLLT